MPCISIRAPPVRPCCCPSPKNSHTRPQEWDERLMRQAQEAREGLHNWFVSQWTSSGSASAADGARESIRGQIRHTFSRLAQRVDTLRQEGWDALGQRLDPMPAHQQRRGGGYYEAPGESTVNQVWEAFFSQMMTSMDSALCEGWIVPDDLSEPFIQLGMPALAIVEIALRSRDNVGVTVRSSKFSAWCLLCPRTRLCVTSGDHGRIWRAE